MRAVLALAALAILAAAAFWFASERGLIGRADPASLTVEARAARLEGAMAEAPDASLAGREDYEALAAALPAPFSLSIGRFDEEDGGEVARDVRLTVADMPDLFLEVDALRAYGLDARAIGAPGEDGTLLAARLAGEGLSIGGLDSLANSLSSAMTEAVAGVPDADLSAQMGVVESYELAADSFVVDGLALKSGLPVIGGEEPLASWRRLAALSLGYEFDQAGLFGGTAKMVSTQAMPAAGPDEAAENLRQDIAIEMPALLYGAYEGGDLAFSYIRDLTMEQVMDLSGGADDGSPVTILLSVAAYAVEDMRLGEVLRYFVAREMPPPSQTDLLSAGKWTVKDMSYGTAAAPIYTVESQVIDMTAFHGLMPAQITAQTRDAWHVDGMMRFAKDSVAAAGASDETADLSAVDDILALLEEEDLSVLRMESDLLYRWTPADGVTVLDVVQDIEGVARVELGFTGALPAYEAFTALDAQDMDAVGDALGAVLADASSLDRLKIVLADEGGFDSALRVAIAYAEAMPDDEVGQLAILRGNEPRGLRAMAGAGITMGGAQLVAQAPELGPFAKAAAAFVTEGGTLTFIADPEPPVGAENAEEISALAANPSALIQRLGLSLTHLPDGAEPQKGEAAGQAAP